MSDNNISYTDEPNGIAKTLDSAEITEDFMPAPEQLIRKVEKEKITIAINKRSLKAYKEYAKKNDAKYQTMINGILSSYADKYLIKK